MTDNDRTTQHANVVIAMLAQQDLQGADTYLEQVVLKVDGREEYERVCRYVALRVGAPPKEA